MTILPPLAARTFTLAPLRDTFARNPLSGKFKLKLLPLTSIPTVPGSANPPNSTRPPKANSPPPFMLMLSPTSSKLLPSGTRRPLGVKFFDGSNSAPRACELF